MEEKQPSCIRPVQNCNRTQSHINQNKDRDFSQDENSSPLDELDQLFRPEQDPKQLNYSYNSQEERQSRESTLSEAGGDSVCPKCSEWMSRYSSTSQKKMN